MCLEKVRTFTILRRRISHRHRKGTATREDIDTTLKLGMNHPMGPLQLGEHTLLLSTRLPRPTLPPQLICAFRDARLILTLTALGYLA